MDKEKLEKLLIVAKAASLEAGKKILEIYETEDFEIVTKSDNSPLTKADKAAHEIIMNYLVPTEIPVLSEEGKDISYGDRKDWDLLWIVDPLDGTKEFIKRNGEFTVNIALVESGVPILGVVYAPVLGKLYSAAACLGGEMLFEGNSTILKNRMTVDYSLKGIRVVASRSHLNNETKEYLERLYSPEIVSMGSSLKFMMLAEGLADVYPRFAPTMEWDTAAAHAVLLELGGDVLDQSDNSLKYNKKNLLNPYFRAE